MKRRYLIPGIAAIGAILIGAIIWQVGIGLRLKKELSAKVQEVADLEHDKAELSDALTNAQSTIAEFDYQIADLSSTVGSLVKLKSIDPELLQKYSKVYFLNDNYVPSDLSPIKADYLLDESRKLKFHARAIEKLHDLMDDMRDDGYAPYIASAYRSFDQQNDLKAQYKIVYGSGTANSFSADQGYSEHQLGTTVDITTKAVGPNLAGFDKTPEYEWLLKNAYKYGFVLSYPKGNAYYIFEPWHWRFVGTKLADDLHDEKKDFIDLSQREIDPYLIDIFD